MLRNRPSRSSEKRTLLTLAALLLVNAGVAHIVIAQIKPQVSGTQQVLGTETVAAASQEVAGEVDPTTEEDESRHAITVYTVKTGDTITGIAEQFHISVNTIRWANDLDKQAAIKVGQKLVILPITGIQYTVKSGDTVSGIAKKFDANQGEILDFNDLENAADLKPGMKVIIPDAEMPAPAPKPTKTIPAKTTTANSATASTSTTAKTSTKSSSKSTGMINPVPGSVLTQGLHDVNAVDFGAPTGTSVRAVKGGTVIVAKNNGAYNGGFGNFIVIDHGDYQTLYAHLSKVEVSVGDDVDQGDEIGKVGSTGRSTGPHLHLEVHGAKNPWTVDKKGTHY